MKLAVIGHVEWVTFLKLDLLPKPGIISHSEECIENAAGGGAVTAIKLAELTKCKIDFFTALGKDEIGEKSKHMLLKHDLNLYIAWKNEPTRKGISMIDNDGERAITVIGKRIQPEINDRLPWELLASYDGIFITACDQFILKESRKAKHLLATPRLGFETLNSSQVKLDVLIGSKLDPFEKFASENIHINPRIKIETEGRKGGIYSTSKRYSAKKLTKPLIDSYGCGDSFAAGVTAGISAGLDIEEAINIGSICGAECATYFGPYLNF